MAITRANGVVEHSGCVLKFKRDYVQIMSDVWEPATKVLYWDAKTLRPTYTWVYNDENVEVDATKEVEKQYFNYVYNVFCAKLLEEAKRNANRIEKDVEVRVVGGRLAKKGTVGRVVVALSRVYGRGYRAPVELKVGIATSDVMIDVVKYGRTYKNYRDVVWAWARNVERVTPAEIDHVEIDCNALAMAKRTVEANEYYQVGY